LEQGVYVHIGQAYDKAEVRNQEIAGSDFLLRKKPKLLTGRSLGAN
jgi:hypothetical protein